MIQADRVERRAEGLGETRRIDRAVAIGDKQQRALRQGRQISLQLAMRGYPQLGAGLALLQGEAFAVEGAPAQTKHVAAPLSKIAAQHVAGANPRWHRRRFKG